MFAPVGGALGASSDAAASVKASQTAASAAHSEAGPATSGRESGTGEDVEGVRKAWLADVNKALHKSYPYPAAARRRGLEGEVKLKIWVDEDGRIVDVAVHKSSGHEVLDRAAIEAVQALGRVPTPPSSLGWKRSAMIVPFDYRLQS